MDGRRAARSKNARPPVPALDDNQNGQLANTHINTNSIND